MITARLLVVMSVVVGALQLGPPLVARPRFKLLPQDQAGQVPAFKAYRDAMQAAVAARDADRVLAMMHPEIGQGGLEMALRTTKAELSRQEHQSWTALEELLHLGGTFTSHLLLNRVRGEGQRQYATREFCAPYTWSAYPRPLPDELEQQSQAYPWVVLGSDVAVRARPPRDMRVLMRLDYDLVHPFSTADDHAGAPANWIGILTPDGRRGYVATSLIRRPDAYHACFGEFDGMWLMTEFARR